MGKVIGIDLGTTNSVAAIKKESIIVLQNRESEQATRSCVGSFILKKGNPRQILVGSTAIERMKSDAENTILSIKRLMGRGYGDEEISKVKKRATYKIVQPKDGTNDSLCVVMGDKEYIPTEISAMILKKIKEDAEYRLHDTVDRAVITVPAYFTEKQRAATRKAGWLAGLKVQKIVSEPTAAAIAYGMDNVKQDEHKTILVYDLGGGTFDVSILTIAGGVFAELAKSGDMWLGGDDFDYEIVDLVIRHIKDEYGVDVNDLEDKKRCLITIKQVAEKAKITLSSAASVEISTQIVDKDKNIIDVTYELTREKFEDLICDQIKRSVDIVKTALKNAHLEIKDIDHILLVGGSTMMPIVERVLCESFGKDKVIPAMDQMNCVAQGAAILAQRLSEELQCLSCEAMNPNDAEICSKCGQKLLLNEDPVFEVTPKDYGVLTVGDNFDVIIPKGSPYPSPSPIVKSFYTPRDNMRRIKVPVMARDENQGVLESQSIVWLPLNKGVPKDTRVDVALSLDINGILEIIKVNVLDGSGHQVVVNPDRGEGERSKLEKQLQELKQSWDQNYGGALPFQREEAEKMYNEAIDAINANQFDEARKRAEDFKTAVSSAVQEKDKPAWARKSEGIISYIEFLIREYGSKLDPQKTYKIKKLVEDLKEVMATQDEKTTEIKYKELDAELETLPSEILFYMRVTSAIFRARACENHVAADKAQGLLIALKNAFDNESNEGSIKQMIDELGKLLIEIEGDDPSKDKTPLSDLLKAGK